MSVVPVLAALISVLLALTTGALVVIRWLWPWRPATGARRLPWAAVGDVPDGHPVSSPDPGAQAPVRAATWRWAGMAVGAVGAVGALAAGGPAWGAMVAWPVFGLGVLAGTFAGELGVPAPAGPVRSAGLRVRRLLDYVPRALGALVCVATAGLFALATVTTAAGVSGNRSATDRDIVCFAGPTTYSSGPWPGAYYTVPVLSVVVVGLVLAGFVLRRVVRRPRATDIVEIDDVSRRRSAEMVTAAVGVLVLTPFIGIAATAGLAIWWANSKMCDVPLWDSAGPALWGLAYVAFLATAWCGGYLLLPSTRSTDPSAT